MIAASAVRGICAALAPTWLGLGLACGARPPPAAEPAPFQPPRLLNREAITEALRAYAPEKEARVVLWIYVDTAGIPTRIQIRTGTGRPALDSAAVRVARLMEFEPARRDDRAIPAWVEQSLVFVPAPELPPEVRGRIAPRLLNDVSLVETVRRSRAAREGEALLWLRVGTNGRVREAEVLRASDARAARAARDLAREFRFAAALDLLAGDRTRPREAAAVYRVAFGPAGTVLPVVPDLDEAEFASVRAAAPTDVPPALRDPADAVARLRAARGRITAPALLWVFVDPDGRAAVVHVRASTGDPDADRALAETARRLDYVPARRAGSPAGGWLEIAVPPGTG